MLGQAALFYFGSPWVFHIIKDIGYLLELLDIETIQTSKYNLKGCIVRGFKWSFFCMFEIKSFYFDVVMCDLVHDVRAIHGQC